MSEFPEFGPITLELLLAVWAGLLAKEVNEIEQGGEAGGGGPAPVCGAGLGGGWDAPERDAVRQTANCPAGLPVRVRQGRTPGT